jgi:S-formylglutathione hydrolase FrmB
MAICEIHLGSGTVLQRMTSFKAIIPEKMKGPFPVLYLLHGLSDDHTAWTRWTSIDRYVRDLPLIVVMPDAERSWYTDAVGMSNAAFETFITRDLIGFVDESFNTIRSREGRATCGQSMGGYGAFKLALKHPDLFCAAASHSGALVAAEHFVAGAPERVREMSLIFGDNPKGGPDDLMEIIALADRETLPALYMDCGADDFLFDANQKMHRHLESLGIRHEYHEDQGNHNWEYWDRRIQISLEFIKKALKIG